MSGVSQCNWTSLSPLRPASHPSLLWNHVVLLSVTSHLCWDEGPNEHGGLQGSPRSGPSLPFQSFTLSLHLHHSAQPYIVLSQALEPNKSICLQSSRNHLSCSLSGTLLAVLCCLLPPLGRASILERSSLITRSPAHPSTPPFFLRALSTLPSHRLSQHITVHVCVCLVT